MAKTNVAEKTAETAVAEPKAKKTATESKYFVADFVANPSLFNTSSIIVKTALEMDGKTEYTLSEAKEIINKFKNKEVK